MMVIKFGYCTKSDRVSGSFLTGLKMETSFFSKRIFAFYYSVCVHVWLLIKININIGDFSATTKFSGYTVVFFL